MALNLENRRKHTSLGDDLFKLEGKAENVRGQKDIAQGATGKNQGYLSGIEVGDTNILYKSSFNQVLHGLPCLTVVRVR